MDCEYWLKVPGSYVSVIHTEHITRMSMRSKSYAHRAPGMPVSNLPLSVMGDFSQSDPLVRSRCICIGRGYTCVIIAASLCKAHLKVFCMKMVQYKCSIINKNNNIIIT